MAVIGLDATYLSVYGKGVSRHQYNLIKGLAKLDKKNCYFVFLNKKNILPELPKQENLHYIRIYIPKHIIWDQFQLPLIIIKYKLDIYHSLIDTLPFWGKGKFVLSVIEIPDYRIGLLRRSGYNSLYTRLSQRYNKIIFQPSLKKAKVIITGSHSTKRDLIQKYNVDEKKIRVLYHAPDEQFYAADNERDLLETRKRYNAQTGYILHISSSDPRDNTPAVIRAYYKAQSVLKTPKKLIICGDFDSQKMGFERLIRELNLKDNIIFTGYVSEKELTALYQAADLYVDPSLYEGFGFQVIEAMACGIPVITSNVTSLPEVIGEAGILVAPTDINGLANALIRVLTDLRLQTTLRQKGLERVKFFSWDRTAQKTLDIYNELLSYSDD